MQSVIRVIGGGRSWRYVSLALHDLQARDLPLELGVAPQQF